MSELTVGHCLHTYLKHESVLWAFDSEEKLPLDLKEEEPTITAFSERASEQAVGLLEGLYTGVMAAGALSGYRAERRSQRRTVRDNWWVEGRLFRPRERSARTLWYLCLGCLKEKGPAATLILKPHEPVSTVAVSRFAGAFAPEVGLQSANPCDCFAHDRGFDCGVVVGAVPLTPLTTHSEVVAGLKRHAESFARTQRDKFEQAIETQTD